jgi:signal peptidase I
MPQPAQTTLPRRDEPVRTGPKGKAAVREKSVVREYGEAILIAFGLAIFIRTFFVQAYKIPSGSMEPTLLVGDHILVNKLIYGLRMPESILGLTPFPSSLPWGTYLFKLEEVHRGDVIVFVFPVDRSKDFIKRVVGVAGDTVEIKDGMVYLNGVKALDPQAHFEVDPSARSQLSRRDNTGPIVVPQGKVFMMGDNRDRSFDSRFWGFVDRNDVEGRALVIYWSWDSDSAWLLPVRWSRIGHLVK